MNPQLLQHYVPLSGKEQQNSELLRIGHPYVATNTLSDRRNILMANGYIDIYRESRYIVQEYEHTHNHVEIVYAFSGDSCHIVNGDRVSMRSGELLLLNQRARHKTPTLTESDVVIYFNCLPQFFDKFLEMSGDNGSAVRRFITGCMRGENSPDGSDYMYFKVGGECMVQNQVENLLYALTFNKQNQLHINQMTMGLLLLYLSNLDGNEAFESGQSALIAEVTRYIEEHYAHGSLNDLAKRLYCDASRLSKNIKQLTGSNFSELLRNKRIPSAKPLLQTTDLSVLEVARMVGCSNITQFHKRFREQAGVSPGDFRRQAGV